MELRVPIDVLILRLLSDGELSNPVRMHYLIEQEHRNDLRREFDVDDMWGVDYVQQRMSHLAGIDLLDRVEPESSGLYRINSMGRAALEYYLETGENEFDYVEIAERGNGVEPREVEKEELPWV